MRDTKIYSFTSNFSNYDTLYKYAAILENQGNVTLIPIDIKKLLPKAKIYDEVLAARNNMSLEDLRRKRIEMSDELIVYLNGKDDPCIGYETIMDILCAYHNKKDISISCDNISMIDAINRIEKATLGSIKIDTVSNSHIGLNGGYDISLTEIKITEKELD